MRLRLAAALALGLATVSPAAAEDIFPWSSEQRISADDLSYLNCDELWHARNEIYARNGYRFRTPRGRAVFGDEGWTDNPRLSRTEQANVARIQAYERDFCQ